MIEKIDSKLKKILDEIPYIYYKVRSSHRFKIADGTLVDGRVYPVVFVDLQDMALVSPSNNPLTVHAEEYEQWQRVSMPQSSLSVSRLVNIQMNHTAIPLNLQSRLDDIGEVRGTDAIYFNALTVSGGTNKCVVHTGDPYYCVKLPKGEPSSNIVDVTPLSIDCLGESIYSTEIKPSVCIYTS